MNINPVIGLYGIGGVYNYGCEAIVRGTESLIRKVWPNAIIKYASPRLQDDQSRLTDTDVEIIDRQVPNRISLKRAYLKMLRTGGIPWIPFAENIGWIHECDIILSIGGDIYTIPNYNASRWITGYYHPLVHFGELVRRNKKKLVVWGASIGPFDANPRAKSYFLNHLDRVELITAREPETFRYLNNNSIINNVVATADPAFFMPVNPIEARTENTTLRIGINLSPLAARQSFGNTSESIITSHARLVTALVQHFEAEVVLIPHVFCSKIHDDDYRYLSKVYNSVPRSISGRVVLIDEDKGFLHMHSIIESCQIVLAARMHCAINSILSGNPTVFLSYSRKSKGMCEYIYGNSEFCINLSDYEEGLILHKVEQILNDRPKIVSFLTHRVAEIREDADLSLTRLRGLIE